MSRKKVLIADPNPATRATIRVGLEEFGFEIHECPEFANAASQAAEVTPDVIIVGLDLPSEDAVRVVEEWRPYVGSSAQVVLLIEGDHPGVSSSTIRLLSKPFGITNLLATLYLSLGLKVA